LRPVAIVVIMETLPITEAKARIAELADRAEREHDHFTLTKNGRPTVMLISVAEYESLMETVAVLSDPATRADLADAAETEDCTGEEEMAEIMCKRLGRRGSA
jgi:antitoxin YefM